ncbi:alpha/beta fold hydrolase [Hwangdonia lutea]|uniref:Alpha/beta fold hydrolase n=1 Tax=Hwangdonia lutea TaxID=3075823 RepID=A0AA97ER74_9FLAO|nr:alpha/beta fold hydrolase [Hwangdonia sp. SCSIO 19198]WOD44725.1 alpha/beta fold hydrolase [Hwangdonia sp. SCSIO 19198]
MGSKFVFKFQLYVKIIFLLITVLSFSFLNAQNIFEYEREIVNKEKYDFQEIEFENIEENIKLSGTLITPKSNFDKIVIIVSGSGKDTRYAHSKLAEKLLENNIAVYRYDERGVGKSNGKHSRKVTSLKNDLDYCVKHLFQSEATKNKQIGVIGHSLGGMASIAIAANNPQIDYLIQMATPVNAGDSFKDRISKIEIFKNRDKTIEEIQKLIDTFNLIIHSGKSLSKIKKDCEKARRKLKFSKDYYNIYLRDQMIDFVRLDTELFYKQNDKPLLYIIGEMDELVNANNNALKLQMINNKFIDVKVLKKLRSLFNYQF